MFGARNPMPIGSIFSGQTPGFGVDPLAVDEGPLTTLPQINPVTDIPFVWGGGGQRLTPEDIARKRQMADAQVQGGMDYSPVGSWTQGLARVAQGLVGGLEERRLDKASAANDAETQDMVAKLLATGGAGTAPLAVLANPNASPAVQSIAKLLYERNNPAAKAPNETQQLLIDSGLTPGTPQYQAAAGELLKRKGDPFITASLPGGGFFAGPQSQFMDAITGGGGQPSGAPGTGSAPPAAAVKALLGGEGTDAQFDQLFGQGAAARARGSAGGPMPSASGTFP